MWDDDQECCELNNSKDCFHSCVGCKYGIWRCPVCKDLTVYPKPCSCAIEQNGVFKDE